MDTSTSTIAESSDMVSLKTLMLLNTTQLEYDEIEPLPEWKLPSLKPSDVYAKLSVFHLQASTSIHVCESVVPVVNEEDMQIFIPILNRNELSRFVKKGYKFIHLGLLQIVVIPLFRNGIGAKLLLGSFNLRHTKSVTNYIISAMETSLHDGPVYHNAFPNFPVSLIDPHINQVLKIFLKTQGIHMLPGSHSLALQYRFMYRTPNTLTLAAKNGRQIGQTIVMHSSTNSIQITHEVITWDKVSFLENWLIHISLERKALPRTLSSQRNIKELSSTSVRLSFHTSDLEKISSTSYSSPLNSAPVNSNSSTFLNSLLPRSKSVNPRHVHYTQPIPEVGMSVNPKHVHYTQPIPEVKRKGLINPRSGNYDHSKLKDNSICPKCKSLLRVINHNQNYLETTMMSMESSSSKDEWYTSPKYGYTGYQEGQFPVCSTFDKWTSDEARRSQHLHSYVGDKSTPQKPTVQLLNWSNLNTHCRNDTLLETQERQRRVDELLQRLDRKLPNPSLVDNILSNRPLDLSKHVSTKDLDSYITSPQNQQATWDLCTRKERSEKNKLQEESNMIECFDGLNMFNEDTIQEEQSFNVLSDETIQEEQSFNVLSGTSGITLERIMEEDTVISEPLHANLRT
eukprot:Gb_40216 [translate_table: standard]